MKKLFFSLLIVIVILFGCEDRDDNLTSANIRISNKTSIEFNLVKVVADSLFYENVVAEGFSDYLPYEQAFEEMPFTIETDSADFSFTPQDLQLDPLPVGLYTYEINISEEGEIELNFKVD